MFTLPPFEGKYGAFDARGVPTALADGAPPAASPAMCPSPAASSLWMLTVTATAT